MNKWNGGAGPFKILVPATKMPLLPRQPLSIAHLPKGLYVYRLVAKDRV